MNVPVPEATLRKLLSAAMVMAAFAAGIVARFAGAWAYRLSQNPDYAVVVQMARHIAEGRRWPVFFDGQPYMGSLEPFLSAALVAGFGPSPFVVSLGTALLGILLLAAVYGWARSLEGPAAGAIAILLLAIGPVGYFHYMASPRGGYALALLLTVLLIRSGARMAWTGRRDGAVSPVACAGLGFLGGLAFWNFWLALPAVLSAGLLLFLGLRWRILRWRVWVPGLLGFALGSLPFWVWNAQHDWRSFASGETVVHLRQALQILRLLLTERLPMLLDVTGTGRVRTAGVLGAYGVLTLAGLYVYRPHRRVPWSPGTWMMAGMILYAALFSAAYVTSPASLPRTPRYLLPWIPLFAVIAGPASVRLFRTTWAPGQGRRSRAGHRLAAGAAALSLLLILTAHLRSLSQHRVETSWHARAQKLAEQLRERGIDAASVDYVLYGFNWAAGERFCFSASHAERYPPFARTLELAERPAVLENLRAFDQFLSATGASARSETLSGYRVSWEASPPRRAVVPLEESQIRTILDPRGRCWKPELTDLFLSTAASVLPRNDGVSWLEVEFTEPVRVCGVRAWILDQRTFGTWSILGRPPGSSDLVQLSPPHASSAYFWSGDRFYSGGEHWREEQRFEPVEVQSLRIVFRSRASYPAIRISELQLLLEAPDALPSPDAAAIAQTVHAERLTHVYADRWLANQLSRILGDTVWTSREPSVFGDPPGTASRVRLHPGMGIAAEASALPSVRRSLERLGVSVREVETGGVTLVLFPETDPGMAQYEGLRFHGLMLAHADPEAWAHLLRKPPGELPDVRKGNVLLQESLLRQEPPDLPLEAGFFDGRLALLGLSSWPTAVLPGEHWAFESHWRLPAGWRVPRHTVFFVHFLLDGRRIHQQGGPLRLDTSAFAAGEEALLRTFHTIQIPAGVPPGRLEPVLGLYRQGLLHRRMRPKTDCPLLNRRIVLPAALEIAP